jgi:2-haloacid dehalogenase
VSAGEPITVTFDLFSALIDSRTGAGAVFDRLSATYGWSVDGKAVYDAWDVQNKRAQRLCSTWQPYRALAAQALAEAYAALQIEGDVAADLAQVLDSLPTWPLWPDVSEGLPTLGERYRLGLLSNVDDELFARTQAAAYIQPDLAMTSERLGAYKPSPAIYERAQGALGPIVHIPTSARDVRGALEAGLPVVRLRRPGHELDPDGPRPTLEASHLGELEALVPRAARRSAPDGSGGEDAS